MTRASRAVWLLLLASLAGCSTVGDTASTTTLKANVRELVPGTTTAADIERRWGRPRTVTEFRQGHEVWQYYHPRGGLSLASALPLVDLMSTERGRAAVEVVLLFDREKVLRQTLIRDLPGELPLVAPLPFPPDR
jgi:hypothetical protein